MQRRSETDQRSPADRDGLTDQHAGQMSLQFALPFSPMMAAVLLPLPPLLAPSEMLLLALALPPLVPLVLAEAAATSVAATLMCLAATLLLLVLLQPGLT